MWCWTPTVEGVAIPCDRFVSTINGNVLPSAVGRQETAKNIAAADESLAGGTVSFVSHSVTLASRVVQA